MNLSNGLYVALRDDKHSLTYFFVEHYGIFVFCSPDRRIAKLRFLVGGKYTEIST